MMLPPIPSEWSAFVFVPQSKRRRQLTHRDSVPSVDITCWRLHGRPPTRGRGGCSGSARGRGGNSRAHHSIVVKPPSSGSESMPLFTFEIELICSMLSRLNTFVGASSSFAHSDNFARSGNSLLVNVFMSHSTFL
ncbi:hypothetical protein Acr_00g0044950 [Actinidia rufa]|uniref:Uncharacterized protein n=1 Tax=Actinidia rufa TaxID=165716 RepID=A0A7J0DKT4_9ERIC|nr:hypothetical protein Acr_00g0044950 [Actinidia rufa]